MIITVTMNPAIDRTVQLTELVPGQMHRFGTAQSDVGGKGINVSKMLRTLGTPSVACGILAGRAGDRIEKQLADWEIESKFVRAVGETRTNEKLIEQSGRMTELNEAGPEVTLAQLEEVKATIRQILTAAGDARSIVAISGSVPRGVPKNFYRELVEEIHDCGGTAILDADGELFRESVKAKPDYVKPNAEELRSYFAARGENPDDAVEGNPAQNADSATGDETANQKANVPEDSTAKYASLIRMGRKLQSEGIPNVIISMGGEGALFLREESANGATDESAATPVLYCPALPVKAISTVGAGDSVVAALCYGFENNLSWEDTVRRCIAASAGAVTTAGTRPPEPEVIEELISKVKIESLVI